MINVRSHSRTLGGTAFVVIAVLAVVRATKGRPMFDLPAPDLRGGLVDAYFIAFALMVLCWWRPSLGTEAPWLLLGGIVLVQLTVLIRLRVHRSRQSADSDTNSGAEREMSR